MERILFLVKGAAGESRSQPESERDVCQISCQFPSSCSADKLHAKYLCNNSFGSFTATIDK